MKFDFSFRVGEKVRFYQHIICGMREMELNETGVITNIIRNGAHGHAFLGVQWEKKKRGTPRLQGNLRVWAWMVCS